MNKTLTYIQKGIEKLLAVEGLDKDGNPFKGGFSDKLPFRLTQTQALEAYLAILKDDSLSDQDKALGYNEIATAVGKTGIFVALIKGATEQARLVNDTFNVLITVPKVNLLRQTKKSFAKFAPELVKDIGIFGDNFKQSGLPITPTNHG